MGDLVREVGSDVSRLMRQELELAKAELRQDAGAAAKAGSLLGGAGLAGWLAVVFVSFTVMWALGLAMPLWLAALIVAVIWAVAGAVMFVQGRARLARLEPGPEQTVETLKEDIREAQRWASRRSS